MAISSFGTLLKLGNAASTEVFATIAQVKDIKFKIKAEMEEITSHSSTDGWVEHIPTLLDGDKVKFKANWVPGDATQSFSAGLLKDLVGRTKRNFQLVIPTASPVTWTIPAYVSDFSGELPVKGVAEIEVELTVSGKPTLA